MAEPKGSHTARYCSRSCAGLDHTEEARKKIADAHRKPKVERTCLQCGKVFMVKSEGKVSANRKFCSRKCNAIYRVQDPEVARTFAENMWRGGNGWEGTKRPDMAERMRKSNPMANPEIRKKVSQILTGRTFLSRGGNGHITDQQEQLRVALGLPESALEFPIPTANAGKHFESLPSSYKVDLAIVEIKLAIEIDGRSHKEKRWEYLDQRKTAVLNYLGWTVLRFWNKEINQDLARCVQMVLSTISRLKETTITSQTEFLVHNCHQFKSKSSDRGVAFHQLVSATKRVLTLTGTFFGGKSTSIFWLLHRLNHGVRRDFAFHDEKRWARLYGVLETTRRRRRNEDADEDGVYTGNRRYRNQAKEQPGVSPAIVSRLLDTTIFLSLKDLNLALPAYKEEVVALDMLDDQGQQYHSMDSSLKQLAVQSSRYLSTWLQWSLARPNSAFRDEVVVVDEVDGEDGKSVRKVPLMELPAINPNGHKWLPKENWLADFCKLEKQQGRKVLIYVRQTGTRDIQDRVQMPLQANGLRVAILGSNIDPRKREDWIAKRAHTIDALICNPRLVETGLDLVQFSTVIFFEIEYSLYTLMAKRPARVAVGADPASQGDLLSLLLNDGSGSSGPHRPEDEGGPARLRG